MGLYLSPFQRIVRFLGSILYLESGFIQLKNIAPCHQDTYKPSALHYNAAMGAGPLPWQGLLTLTDTAPYFEAETLAERDSLSTGCETKIDSITKCDVTYDEVGVFCDGDEIRRLKNIQAKISPSNFTGKTQKYVQALYGSIRTDYSTDEGYLYLNMPFYVGAHQLHYAGTSFTSGIVCGTDYTYFLLQVLIGDVSSISYYELVPSPAGATLRDSLIINGGTLTADELNKLESYLFSTCTPSTTAHTITVSGGSAVLGEVAAYGWQFNNAGTKANIILHQDNLPTDQNLHAYHYQLDFTETSGIITATLTTVTSNTVWSAVHGTNVVRPDYILGDMLAMVNPKKTPFSGWTTLTAHNAPCFCFYDDDDVLQIISTKAESAPYGTTSYTAYPYGVQEDDVLIYEAETHAAGRKFSAFSNGVLLGETINNANLNYFNRQVYGYSGTTSPASLGFGTGAPENHPSEFIEGTGRTVQQFALDNGWYIAGALHSFSTGALGPLGETVYLGTRSRSNVINFYSVRSLGGGAGTNTGKLTVSIPFGSCKSVIVTTKNKSGVSGGVYWNSGLYNVSDPGLTKAEVHYFDFYTPSGGGAVVYSNVRGPYNVSNRRYNQSGSDSFVSTYNTSLTTAQVAFKSNKNGIEIVNEELPLGSVLRDKYFDINYATDAKGYFTSIAGQGLLTADRGFLESGYGVWNYDYPYDLPVGWG